MNEAAPIRASRDPAGAEALALLGDRLHDGGRYGEAIDAYRQAVDLDPSRAFIWNNLAVTLNTAGLHAEALDACERAIVLSPGDPAVHANRGIALKGLGRLAEAEAAYRRSLALRPDAAATWSSLGSLQVALGRHEEAVSAWRRALDIDPGLFECRLKLTMLLPAPGSGAPGEADSGFLRGLDDLEGAAERHGWPALGAVIGVAQPFALAYRPGEHLPALSRYGGIACRARSAWFREHYGDTPAGRPPQRSRLRLLIVSGQVSNHSVWNVLLHGILKHLDRDRFEVILYNTARQETAEAHLAQTLVDRYHQHVPDWLRQTLLDQPDAVYYPEIGMDPVAAQLATLRLAPLQVAGWGHPITTGLPTIDLFCSGELLEPSGADNDYSERLVRLPGTGACSIVPPVRPSPVDPEACGLPEDRQTVRLLICQQAAKLDQTYDSLYPRIACAIPNSRFYFVRDKSPAWDSAGTESRLCAAFRDHGLNPADRLCFVDWQPGERFLTLLDVMDIYLDAPAFSGYTTAWLALHRGLPVVTLEGRYMRQRLAAGLLRRIGCSGTIAADPDDYVLKTAVLAENPLLRRQLRVRLPAAAARADEDTSVVRVFETVISGITAGARVS